ncbi:hypothetical protein I4F81_009292 [Pyropia yezoensis]|uniref:Uncharacterized protein n=1 Tax=Pyropia yezoensis TaxID=2788 RepID=A0ACC3C9C7_PYRYE|nr:hypothetical protein I4F81_009292 [Neopyropia yezoensis]
MGGATPLAAAAKPTLDRLAPRRAVGLVDPVAPGLACGSDTARLSLLSVLAAAMYRGQGAFKAAGASLPVSPGDVAYKCVYACVDDAGVAVDDAGNAKDAALKVHTLERFHAIVATPLDYLASE